MQDWIVQFMENHGYAGIFLMIFLENVFPPIPSEVILTFGGFMTTHSRLTTPLVILCATAGSVAGASALYAAGHLFSVDKLERAVKRWGRILRLKPGDLSKASVWFERYGYRAIFFCRMIPLIRSLISIPAGMAKMNFLFFLLYTTAGTLIWNTLLVLLGASLGKSWVKVLEWMDLYSHITYALIAIAFAALIVYWIRKRKN
ncbi:DedA family protein [Sporolactobacillus nakayamae]|uniref:Membrane protein DedA, SNARE-associated domain n=1 Tax=Sporolactobacillus nakayamae TaxID=269670 RepID=A0A1I2PH39_9BACL|nr:DedA family protein [Sporolactobacillus nakayamae]SFG15388.1 membrane protein DedA, SNARE-associated domain [Sporolactobacillus nakayamae]